MEKIKTQEFVQYHFPRNRAVYEKMWKNVVESDRTHDNMIRHVYFVCLVIKATDTLRICNTYCFCMPKMVTRTPLTVPLILILFSFNK